MISCTLRDASIAMEAKRLGQGSASAEGCPCLGAAIDSREIKPGFVFFALKGERCDGHEFVSQAVDRGAAACVVAEAWADRLGGARLPLLAVNDVEAALWRLARWTRDRYPAGLLVIAVTGSNGKTTTKAMLHHALSQKWPGRASRGSFNNHLGVPLTLLEADPADRYLVVEIGTNAPGEVQALAELARPHLGIVTSIGYAHVGGLKGLEAVAREKLSLLKEIQPGGSAFLPGESLEARNELRRMIEEDLWEATGLNVQFVRLREKGKAAVAGPIAATGDEGDLDSEALIASVARDCDRMGRHHASNAAMVASAALSLGFSADDVAQRLRSFEPLPGRGARHRLANGAHVLDDSYNANPSSALAGLETLVSHVGQRRIAVLGDMLELGEYSRELHGKVGEAVGRSGVEWLITVGEHAADLAEAGAKAGVPRVTRLADGDGALEVLRRELSGGDVVWVKGSRAMRLERIVNRLLEWDQAAR